ncbi:putative acyl-CoA dehydrogenase [Cupriavidus necator]|uniref:Putative acyl-CoA dehydrogenase n=1 Tax=Cupriavidus necator TaxID=106590 RepID=A0A1K0J0B2_CUPNE|nr:putative acyl-CoA dehydrogenase [Cupriavidus necator]
MRRFVEKEYTFEQRAQRLRRGVAASDEHWRTFAENGWLAAALPEAHGGLGGLGGSVLDTVLIAQEFGRGLVIEPYFGCAVLAAQTFAAAASEAQQHRLLPGLSDGVRRLALAYSETSSRGDPAVVTLTAKRNAGGHYTLRGVKTLVLGALGADGIIVSARLADGPVNADEAISLFLVDAAASGLSVLPMPLHDGTWAAECRFDAVQVDADALLGDAGNGLAALRHGHAHAIAALGAELVGGMERAIEITADYLKLRKQFGVAIGSFQVLQHRMADMATEMELARSMLYALLAAMASGDPVAQQYTASQAKARIGRAAKFVCGQAIQLHGGIGMTDEYAVGHYFKRAVVADLLFGNSDQHEAACAASLQRALCPA